MADRAEVIELLNRRELAKIGLVTVSARELIAHPPPKPIEVVSDLIPAGLSLLASAPKVGKSWLAYQAAVAVATGGDVLGHTATRGDVLYLALEDGEYRAWSRITSILRRTTGQETMPAGAAELEVAFLAGRGDAMVDQVETWLASHADAAIVLVDTLQKVRPRSASRQPQYAIDVDDVGRILELTKRHPRIALQVVHHDTKASRAPGADFVDAVSGTSGIGGSVDTILVLRRKRHESVGTLEVTGKDIREGLLHLAYDEAEPFWSVDPAGGLTDEQRQVLDWLRDNGPAGAKAVGEALGRERTATQKMLDRMAETGALVKNAGRFDVPLRVTHVTRGNDDTRVTDGTRVTHGTRENGE